MTTISLSFNDSGQVIHTCASVIKQYNMILTVEAGGGDSLWLGGNHEPVFYCTFNFNFFIL